MDFLIMCQYKLNIKIKYVHWNWSCTCFFRYQMHLHHSMNKYVFPITNYKIIWKNNQFKGKKKPHSNKNPLLLPLWVPYPHFKNSVLSNDFFSPTTQTTVYPYSVSSNMYQILIWLCLLGFLIPQRNGIQIHAMY